MLTHVRRGFPHLTLALLIVSTIMTPITARGKDILLHAFFRGNGENGVYLAWSEDGIHFTPLHDGQPVLSPGPWPGQQLTRDPSILYHDGKFRAVWTTNWKGRGFGYAESPDLVHWSQPLQVQPFPADLPEADQPRNVWAPEIHWDAVAGDYLILWSSTTDRESENDNGSGNDGKPGGNDHRIYATRTKDGKTFSRARLWFDQGFSVIDAQMVFDDRWIMVVKDEKNQNLGGKNLRLTFCPRDFSQPWTPVSAPVAGPGSTLRPHEMAEGPCLLRWHDQWHLYWDAFANGHYCLATSTDLRHWTDRSEELHMPAQPRHGTVFGAPRGAVGWLRGVAVAKP